ncbi:EAL domain-containing protein (putative c-di-GMP-specific phosphodiesterase class I) [Mycolicibacterium iranicum]|uniref:EAL domain-containing protein (Putative c-di-GMP-specific phosphodiesterase class I) n=1 Tax=Mycolicibacterium iranicum TaxID=912594 RepID=A0A839QC14_MYCIR|nr:EAL domain-containing protein [Mycolicibacterium iranicum]MBB2990061.1 EAL domain-containing protein (putative c-di-GMP-specific phosphodiesterase class I) [Mycolicibacterium iranicum]
MTSSLDHAAVGRGLVTGFQPVVSLPSGEIVGYEALARWPQLRDTTPLEVFDRARETGTLDCLDRLCIRSATRNALDGNSTPGMLLLVNSEPGTPYAELCADTGVRRAADTFHLAFEITERGLMNDPHALLRKIAALRSMGIAIALDDIGAHPDSVALLDVVAPDILKLDIGLVQRHPDRIQAKTIAAIREYHDRTGAVICAEGIETDAHLQQAMAYGATLGQGFKFGAAGDLAVAPAPFRWPAMTPATSADTRPSIFDVAATGQRTRRIRRSVLTGLLNQMQRVALKAEVPPILLATLGHEEVADLTRQKLRCIAETSPFVAVLGTEAPAGLGRRVRTIDVPADDPVAREVSMVVLGADVAMGLAARAPVTGSAAGEADPFFEVVLVFDRERAAAMVRSLLGHSSPTISIHVEPDRRKLASCTCGWQAERRRLWSTAVGDVADHRIKTGHVPLDQLAG